MSTFASGYLRLGSGIAGLLALAALGMVLRPAETARAEESAQVPSYTPGVSSSQVFVNPETGEIGAPTPAQAASLSEAVNTITSRSDKGLAIRKSADGTETVALMGRYQNVSIATVDTDGLHTNCVTDGEHAHDAHTAEVE